MRSGKLLRKRKKIGHFDQNFEPVANCNENKGGNLCKKRLELYNKKQKKISIEQNVKNYYSDQHAHFCHYTQVSVILSRIFFFYQNPSFVPRGFNSAFHA